MCNTCALRQVLKFLTSSSVCVAGVMDERRVLSSRHKPERERERQTHGRWIGMGRCEYLLHFAGCAIKRCLKGETWEFVSLVRTDQVASKQQPNSCRLSFTVTVTNPLIYRDETNQYNTQSKSTQTLQVCNPAFLFDGDKLLLSQQAVFQFLGFQ